MNKHRPIMCEFLGTPEAGKTTAIHILEKKLNELGYKCCVIQESAELLPEFFEKGSIPAHFWMRLNTAKSILETIQKEYDIVLIDRGIIDTLFWDILYHSEQKLPHDDMMVSNNFFLSLKIMPNLIILLTIPPEESIRRRGGEGRVVTLPFVKEFNEVLFKFIDTVSIPVFRLNTLGKTPTQVSDIILNQILQELE